MEERIVDDEFGRGVRVKKLKDGKVDVEDGLAPETEEEGEEMELVLPEEEAEGEAEASYVTQHVYDDEDDEDLIGLSAEEAERVRAEKAEAARARKERYQSSCLAGEKLLASGSYRAAELVYEKALKLDDEAVEASVGYWRAKTADFSDPDVLIGEYVDEDLETLESDLGFEAADVIKEKYRAPFEKRLQELKGQEEPLAKEVEEKKSSRKEMLKARISRSSIAFLASLLPFIGAVIAAIVVAFKINTVPDDRFVIPTIALGVLSMALFIVFLIFTNKFTNDLRMYRMNEKLSSTEEGRMLLEIRRYKRLYEDFLYVANETEE